MRTEDSFGFYANFYGSVSEVPSSPPLDTWSVLTRRSKTLQMPLDDMQMSQSFCSLLYNCLLIGKINARSV